MLRWLVVSLQESFSLLLLFCSTQPPGWAVMASLFLILFALCSSSCLKELYCVCHRMEGFCCLLLTRRVFVLMVASLMLHFWLPCMLFSSRSVKSGSLLIDSSTIEPGVSQEVAKLAEAKGASFFDAPVSGGKHWTWLCFAVAEHLDFWRGLFSSQSFPGP